MEAIDLVECGKFATVNVEHTKYDGFVMRSEDGNHDFRTREAAAGDMARELLDIRDDERTALLPGCSTDTTSEGDMHTSHRSLEWSQYKFFTLHPVKPRPEEAHGLMDGTTHIGHDGNSVSLAINKRPHLFCQ